VRLSLGALLPALVLLAPTPSALAFTQPKAKIALHVQPHFAAKKISPCRPSHEGGPAPADLPCTEFESSAQFKGAYDVYLLVTGADSSAGIAGVSCGIDYRQEPGEGVDVFAWTLCGSNEIRGQGPNGMWPNAGGGNMILWQPPRHCQRRPVPGFENQGVHAIAGAFYLYAYSADTLRVTANETRADLERFSVADCVAIETELQDAVMGEAHFISEEGTKGCNPCMTPCAPLPTCSLSEDVLDFGSVPLGEPREMPFEIRNFGPGILRGKVEGGCFPQFRVILGRGAYILEPGGVRKVVVEYFPVTETTTSCLLPVSNVCPPISLVGTGAGASAEDDPGGIFLDSRTGDRVQRFRIRIPRSSPMVFTAFDVSGRVVHRVEEMGTGPGPYWVEWDTAGLPSGVYFLRVETPHRSLGRKLVLVR
jgi:hypothetical protein